MLSQLIINIVSWEVYIDKKVDRFVSVCNFTRSFSFDLSLLPMSSGVLSRPWLFLVTSSELSQQLIALIKLNFASLQKTPDLSLATVCLTALNCFLATKMHCPEDGRKLP